MTAEKQAALTKVTPRRSTIGSMTYRGTQKHQASGVQSVTSDRPMQGGKEDCAQANVRQAAKQLAITIV